jgi:hypothetical protein
LWNGAVNGSTIITTNQIDTMLLRREGTVDRSAVRVSR